MQYKLNVTLRMSGRDCAPGSVVSTAQLADAGVTEKSIKKMTDRKQMIPLISENNPDKLRALHNVQPADMTAPSKLPAQNKLGEETIVEAATSDNDPAPKAAEKVAPAPKGEGLTEDLLADADADAALVAVLERVQPQRAEAVGAHIRASADPRKEAVTYLCFGTEDRDLYEQAVVEVADEKTRIAALADAAAKAGPDLKAQDDTSKVADLHEAHENKLGADLHAKPESDSGE